MRRYSASEAIGPAWEHAVAWMWGHRRWQTGLKLALVVLIAEASGSINFNTHMGRHGGSSPQMSSAAASFLLGFALVFGLIALVIGLILFYVGSRLQFAVVECIATRQTVVAPAWNRYGRLVWRWIGFKALLLLAFVAPLLPVILAMSGRLKSAGPHGVPALGAVLSLALLVIALVIPFALVYIASRDFVLPSLVFEGTTVRFAIKRFLLWLRAETGGVIGYLFLRIVFGFLFAIVAYLALALAMFVSLIPAGVVGGMTWFALRHGGSGAHAVAWLVIGFVALIYFVWAIILTIATFGTLSAFYTTWALYYLGGRYPVLGQLLEPSSLAPVYTPPPSMPMDDDSSGPDLPMSPELA